MSTFIEGTRYYGEGKKAECTDHLPYIQFHPILVRYFTDSVRMLLPTWYTYLVKQTESNKRRGPRITDWRGQWINIYTHTVMTKIWSAYDRKRKARSVIYYIQEKRGQEKKTK